MLFCAPRTCREHRRFLAVSVLAAFGLVARTFLTAIRCQRPGTISSMAVPSAYATLYAYPLKLLKDLVKKLFCILCWLLPFYFRSCLYRLLSFSSSYAQVRARVHERGYGLRWTCAGIIWQGCEIITRESVGTIRGKNIGYSVLHICLKFSVKFTKAHADIRTKRPTRIKRIIEDLSFNFRFLRNLLCWLPVLRAFGVTCYA